MKYFTKPQLNKYDKMSSKIYEDNLLNQFIQYLFYLFNLHKVYNSLNLKNKIYVKFI